MLGKIRNEGDDMATSEKQEYIIKEVSGAIEENLREIITNPIPEEKIDGLLKDLKTAILAIIYHNREALIEYILKETTKRLEKELNTQITPQNKELFAGVTEYLSRISFERLTRKDLIDISKEYMIKLIEIYSVNNKEDIIERIHNIVENIQLGQEYNGKIDKLKCPICKEPRLGLSIVIAELAIDKKDKQKRIACSGVIWFTCEKCNENNKPEEPDKSTLVDAFYYLDKNNKPNIETVIAPFDLKVKLINMGFRDFEIITMVQKTQD